MSKEIKLIPELRFSEFQSLGSWNDKPISQLGETVNGLSGKKGADFGSGKPYVQYKQVFDKSYIDFSECGKVDFGHDENQNTLQKGDILFTTSSETPNEVGYASVIINQPEEDTYLNSFCFILRPFDLKEVNPSFSRYLFHSLIYRDSVSAIAQGSTRFNLSKGAFLKLKVPVPQPKEQKKIASCLSTLDELLAAQNDKLDALKDHKKGLMQNLFPQEGETVPKVRFPEFEGDGEWEKKELGDLVTIKGRIGYCGYTKEDIVSKGEGAISISPSNISPQGALSFEKSTYITWDKYYESPEIMLENGFTVLVKTGSTFGKVAFISNLVEKATINPQLVVLKPEDINNFFLYLIVSNTAVQSQITATVVGGAIPTLSQDSISKFEVMIPKEKEQQKIASCLSAVDELITAQTERIEQLHQHKKGLMQGLFPNPSASSGETIES